MTSARTVIVIAKAPEPGLCKTRLTPPCSPCEAALLAAAALQDTLDAVMASRAQRCVLVLEGEPADWLPCGFEVIAQRGRGLDERLAAAFIDTAEPSVLVGMDTPQVTPALLTSALDALEDAGAVLGSTLDGGFWAVGLRRPTARAFAGVPMSTAGTGGAQHRRLESLGLSVTMLPRLQDVDYYDDALAVAATVPDSRFAKTLEALDLDIRERSA
ncbi:MAG: TIGR04282 family arsenosugar biosynthesis glycosyltransferase [Actinomycetota bacterium]